MRDFSSRFRGGRKSTFDQPGQPPYLAATASTKAAVYAPPKPARRHPFSRRTVVFVAVVMCLFVVMAFSFTGGGEETWWSRVGALLMGMSDEFARERSVVNVLAAKWPPANHSMYVPSVMEGERRPQHPEQLPSLSVHHRTYTPDELMALYGNFTIVYTFVNGSDPNHFYRRSVIKTCAAVLVTTEAAWYKSPDSVRPKATSLECLPAYVGTDSFLTTGVFFERMSLSSMNASDNRDRETDELRHSLRSVEEHMGWHQGRVVIVTPGHYPGWIDGAKNFLANRCGGAAVHERAAERSYLRLTVIHQDAILPYGMKLTVNSHSIEQRLWRVKNITAVHLYYNDDYFVNRDVKITDIFNEYGGPILRLEPLLIGPSRRGPEDSTAWTRGAIHSNLFSILELDARPEDYLPSVLSKIWTASRREGTVLSSQRIATPDLYTLLDATFAYPPPQLPPGFWPDVKHRRFITHSPFVYCTNMLAFLETRYEREFTFNSFYHRFRHAQDLYIPFVYNAFMMARPWQASPKFLPYLLAIHEGQTTASNSNSTRLAINISLNNYDGCAPASSRASMTYAECTFRKFVDNATTNEATIQAIADTNPLYFNINTDFRTAEIAAQLRKYLHEKFSTPIYLERGLGPISEEDRALPQLYGDLMKLPVIAVTSFEEGVCPMVRSLQFSLPDHTGVVVSAVARHGTDEERDKTLSELRTEMVHRYRSAVPAVACAYKDRVRALRSAVPAAQTRSDAMSESVLASIVDSALSELQANGTSAAAVPIPSVCGVAGGDGGDVRIRAIVLDGRSDVTDALSLRHAVTMPGQTLALEDFDVVPLADGSGDSVLVLARSASDAKAVHWIDGAAESDLLIAYPLPYADYEDLRAPLQWSNE